MASLDTLLQHMSSSGATGALLRGDAPIQLQTPRGPQSLGIVTNAALERDIREIIPPDLGAALDAGESVPFSYKGTGFVAQQVAGIWQLQIAAPSSTGYAVALDSEPNTSGQGADATVPPQLRGWNWGAFFLPWIWGIGNNVWVSLVALIPCFGFFMRFVMGAKANEWGWRKRRWNSVTDFQNAQKTWALIGAIIFVGGNIALFPITAAVMFPVFARARENARRQACQRQLKQIGIGALSYASSHGNRLPSGNTLAQWRPQISPYVGTASSRNIFHCPADRTTGDSYDINPKMAGASLSRIRNPINIPLMWDKAGHDHLGGRNVLFLDGHVKWFRDFDFQSQIAPQTP